jgi:hypothetical protein
MNNSEYNEKSELLKRLRNQWKFWVINGGKREKIESLKEKVFKLDKELKAEDKSIGMSTSGGGQYKCG